jgi:hypothetical protein
VKTGIGKAQAGGYYAQFRVGQRQLNDTRLPELRYFFVTRWRGRWNAFVIVPQTELRAEQEEYNAGSVVKGSIVFRLVFADDGTVKAGGGRDWTGYLSQWSHWRRIPGRSLDGTTAGELP